MGTRGPVPKRTEERRRQNKPETPVTEVEASGVVVGPEADPKWHPVARQWFDSLARSAQARFYEPSDWSTAFLLAESISRDLKPQPIGVHPETGEAVMASIPMKGASLAAYLKGMSALMVTEGDRRRNNMEIRRADAVNQANPKGVVSIEERRAARLA